VARPPLVVTAARGGPHLAFVTEAAEWGGAESVLEVLVRRATAAAGRVSVLGVDRAVVARLLAAAPTGADRVLLPARAAAMDPRPATAAYRVLRRLRPDLLHVNAGFSFGSLPLQVAAAAAGVRYVVHEHLPLAPGHPRLQRPLKRWTAARASAVVSVGERAARATELHGGLPPGSVRVIRLGVPSARTPPRRVGDRRHLVVVGRLTTQKGVDLLVRCLPDLPDVDLTVVGEGPERPALLALATTLGVQERVQLIGQQVDARALLAGADVVAVPSRWESGPLVLLEAMAEGRPVVVSDVGFAGEALDGERCGRLVPVEDVPALTGALRELLADPAGAARLGDAARARVLDQFGEDVMVAAWRALYQELAGAA